MSRVDRLVLAAPVAVAGLQLGGVMDAWPLGAGLAVVALLTAASGRRIDIGSTLQLMIALIAGVAAWFVAASLTPEDAHWWSGKLTLAASGSGLMALCIAISRLPLEEPRWGYPLTAGMVAFQVVVASTAQAGAAFVVPGLVYLPLQLVALNRADPSRARWAGLTRRSRGVLAGSILICAAACTGLAVSLPPLADASMRYFGWRIRQMGRTGFTTSMSLSSLDDLAMSDTKVLRIYGPRPDHLRGIVYTRYHGGEWLAAADRSSRPVRLAATRSGANATTIWTLGGDRRVLFTPLGLRSVTVEGGRGQVDDLGVLTAFTEVDATWISFELGPRRGLSVRPPTSEDLDVPAEIEPELRSLAREWTGGLMDDRSRLQAIEETLRRDYTYSLRVERRTQDDPVLEFLTLGRRGHCEYFASSMTLLARSLGVPARVAAGYRVTEYNRLGGYHIVRERNAHAWVEAWVRGEGWQTFDPTPASDLALREETPFTASIIDQIAAWARLTWAWLTSLDPFDFIVAGVSALFLYLTVRQLVTWLRRGRRRALARAGFPDPRPSLVVLLAALARRGETRRAREPLEAFARRVRTSPDLGTSADGAADLLLRYAAWRYGSEGDPEALDREIEGWVAAQGPGRG